MGNIFGCQLLRVTVANRIKKGTDPGQISRTPKSPAFKASQDQVQIGSYSTRIEAAQNMLSYGASVGQFMAR